MSRIRRRFPVPRWTIGLKEGVVEYLGVADDVKPHLAAADCVVLPSYREGVPRSLLEAAAIGRPIVTTDAVGCRDAVDDGVNGLRLQRVRDARDLAEKMQRIVEMPPSERELMGNVGRKKMEHEFDEKIVIDRYSARYWGHRFKSCSNLET
jgi:glycosyltransferase involved in cell wall biosynthesis